MRLDEEVLEGAANVSSKSAILSNASSVHTVKAVVDLIGQAFLLTVDIDGPQKVLKCEAFTMSVRSTRGLGTTTSATLNAGDSIVNFPADLGGTALSNLPTNAVIDAQMLEWSVDIYKELQQQKGNDDAATNGQRQVTRSRSLSGGRSRTIGYRPRTTVVSVSLSYNGSPLNINSTKSYIELQLKRHPVEDNSQTSRRQLQHNNIPVDDQESRTRVRCVPSSKIKADHFCTGDNKLEVFGLKQKLRLF